MATVAQTVDERRRHDPCNLTNGQLVMWLGQHLLPDLSCYDNAVTFSIRGPLDVAGFRAAFQALIDRSDALRTVIDQVDRVPVQRVLPSLEYRVPVIDLGPHTTLRAWTDQRTLQQPRLHEQLFDCALVRLGEDETAWYLSTHHVLFDGFSCLLIYQQMGELYRRALDGTLDDAPELALYAAYLALERDARASAEWRDANEHWRAVLDRGYEPVELYGVGAANRTHAERWVSRSLGAERTERLRALATIPGFRSLNVDMSMLGIFSTIVFTYLYRAGGNRSLSIGIPFHNRGASTRETIGMTQQIYPLQVEVEPDDTFTTLMATCMRGLWAALAKAPQGSGNAADPAVNDVMLNYFPLPFPAFDGMPVHTELVPKSVADGNHTLFVQVHDFDASGSLDIDLVFNEGVFGDHQREGLRGGRVPRRARAARRPRRARRRRRPSPRPRLPRADLRRARGADLHQRHVRADPRPERLRVLQHDGPPRGGHPPLPHRTCRRKPLKRRSTAAGREGWWPGSPGRRGR